MKRAISTVDSVQPSRCSDDIAKRRKTRHLIADASRTSPPQSNPSHASPQSSQPSPRPLLLTETVLKHSQQQSTTKERASSIRHWLECCPAAGDCDADMMATPPTPRSTTSTDRGRRPTKRLARAPRTPSPSKRPSPQTYRTLNMSYAGVRVDDLVQLPPGVDGAVREILGLASLDDAMGMGEDQPHLAALVTRFLNQSRVRAKTCSLEGDWKVILSSLLSDLAQGSVQCHTSEKPWNADLKPSSPEVARPDNDSGASTPRLPPPQSALPDFDPQSASGFPGPVPSLPPYTPSIAYTTSTEAADPFYLSTPKPDIVVGLSDHALSPTHRIRLASHQNAGSILSDPHTAPMGLRFPFLIVEAKGLSLNGSLVAAQNQAAVGGACMLQILDDLDMQNTYSFTSPPIPKLCFSITTEGPVHELWVHFKLDEATHMQNIRTWRTTHQRHVEELVCCLARIVKWGEEAFLQGIRRKLETLKV